MVFVLTVSFSNTFPTSALTNFSSEADVRESIMVVDRFWGVLDVQRDGLQNREWCIGVHLLTSQLIS